MNSKEKCSSSSYILNIITTNGTLLKIFDQKPNMKLRELKERIYKRTSIIVKEQRLLFRGKELHDNDETCLIDIDIKSGDTLHLLHKGITTMSFPSQTERDLCILTILTELSPEQFIFEKVDNDLKKYECPICMQWLVSFMPPILTVCGHNFCYHCTVDMKANEKEQCPLCKHANIFGQIMFDMKLYRELSSLQFKCKYSNDDCQFKGNAYELYQHQPLCLGKDSKYLTPESGIKVISHSYYENAIHLKRSIYVQFEWSNELIEVPLELILSSTFKDPMFDFYLERTISSFFMKNAKFYGVDWTEIELVKDPDDNVDFYHVKPHYMIRFRENRQELIHVNLVTLTGKTVQVKAAPNDRIYFLKLLMEEREGIPHQQPRLIFSGRQLTDDKTLASYGIEANVKVVFVLRLRGD